MDVPDCCLTQVVWACVWERESGWCRRRPTLWSIGPAAMRSRSCTYATSAKTRRMLMAEVPAQLGAPDGTPVVRERFWISAQPGEVRACDGCHGVNRNSQAGAGAAQNVALAFRELLAAWRTEQGVLLRDGFE